MTNAEKLRSRFEKQDIVRIAGAHNPLSAKIAENAGFDGVWSSGFEISTSQAVPDANILTMSDFLRVASAMVETLNVPVVADCDTGYGNIHNVMQAVRKFENAGVAAICIEDKLFPKMNSFIPGRQELISMEEFTGKIEAAKSAQQNRAFMVIARVEALIAGHDMNEALRRAAAYANAGADAILIHSNAQTAEQIADFCQQWDFRAPVVVVPTTYNRVRLQELKDFGVKMVIYANQGIRSAIKAMEKTYKEIIAVGDTHGIEDKIASLDEVFALQGMQELKQNEKRYLRKNKSK